MSVLTSLYSHDFQDYTSTLLLYNFAVFTF